MSKKTLIGALAAAGTASLYASLLAPDIAPNVAAAPQLQARVVHTATNPLIATLPVRQALGAPQGELFASPGPRKPRRAVVVAAPPEPPAPPPMPYRLAGSLTYDGETNVVLARGDKLYPVQIGDALDGGYRVEAVEPDNVTLVYESLAVRQRVAATAMRQTAVRRAARPFPRYVSAGLR